MRYHKTSEFSRSAWVGMASLLAMFFLAFSGSAHATAPRITPELFGEATKADIVGYQFAPPDAAATSDGELAVKIVTAAFKAAGKKPTLEVLPSKQLATYALLNNDAVAMIGSPQDLPEKERKRYRAVTFYLRGIAPAEEPVSLIFSKNARENEWYQAFNKGLRKIIKSGAYLEILEKHHGKRDGEADYFDRLKRHKLGWK
jgi:hypothetical protein